MNPSVTRLATVALALVALLTACATKEQWVYEKRAVTPTRLDHDLMACRDEARSPQALGITLEERATIRLHHVGSRPSAPFTGRPLPDPYS
jgi:hypothetical protein